MATYYVSLGSTAIFIFYSKVFIFQFGLKKYFAHILTSHWNVFSHISADLEILSSVPEAEVQRLASSKLRAAFFSQNSDTSLPLLL